MPISELDFLQLKLRVSELEKDKVKNDEIMQVLIRAVNTFNIFVKKFDDGNGDGIVPKIINGLSSNFKTTFEDYKKDITESFQAHELKVSSIIAVIPCSKMIGDGCSFRLIAKEDNIPEGWKAVMAK